MGLALHISIKMSNPTIAEIEEALSRGSYTVVELVQAGGNIAETRALTSSGLEFEFQYSYQGVWDRENATYVDFEEVDSEFVNSNWENTGENIVIPDTTGQYEHSYILQECRTLDGQTITTY